MLHHNSILKIADKEFSSRLFLGTGKFSSIVQMQQAVISSSTELVTVALKRVDSNHPESNLIQHLNLPGVNLLPNTSGARNAKEAILCAELCREVFSTNWLKLEIHPDPKYLLPDPIETLAAAEELVKRGFIILPYINADPVLCKRLEDIGASAVMPLGSPIGSNNGLQSKAMLKIIIEQSNVPVIVDAGIGAPSHAAEALELGADAVLVNTAIAIAGDPSAMADAFSMAVVAGRMAYESSLAKAIQTASASSPLTSFLSN